MLKIIRFILLDLIFSLLTAIFTRTQVSGLENVPKNGGPYIFASNHVSTYDALLLARYIPAKVRPVGPGDFKLLWPANVIVEKFEVILIQRGAPDRDSLKKMVNALKDGENLSLFPEGGTWEKRLDDVKPGVAYLSLVTGAPIIPIALGGTYQVWGRILRLQRPRIKVHFLPPMPPVENTERRKRQDDLRRASLDLMQRIYEHLPPQDQALYDLHARQIFSAKLQIVPNSLDYSPTGEEFNVLAELVSKPNLFSPLHRNLKLPLDPFLQPNSFYAASEVLRAVQALQVTLTETLEGFANYRLGDRKAAQLLTELAELEAISIAAAEGDAVLRFVPSVSLSDEPLPPNE